MYQTMTRNELILLYDELIDSAKKQQCERRNSKEWFEGHHIIPRCIGGLGESHQWKNKKPSFRHDNIVGLTPSEHLLAHLLLALIHRETEFKHKLYHALDRSSTFQGKKLTSAFDIDIELLSNVKKELSEYKSKLWLGDNNPARREDVRQKISESKMGDKNPMSGIVGELHHNYGKPAYNPFKPGKDNPGYGKVGSLNNSNRPDVRAKLSEIARKRAVIVCPHCGLSSQNKTCMQRWHFDNCKFKK